MAGSICPGLLWSIIWFLLMLFIGWPVSGFLAAIYVILLPFAACIEPLNGLMEGLLKLVKLPYFWTKKAIRMAPLSECSLDE
ncbi:unnamed protein product [Dibothriocephalus latus]|uniref:Uncharacterized protein n=1 Tax=Dibothriocephalus latus TaxID=60516 RepID=A0A3P7L2C8_DIBLA|nr:unnamed protein product [Dibothriocephalus latus]